MTESNFYSAEYVNSILQENKSLEQVNVTLLDKLQTLEQKLVSSKIITHNPYTFVAFRKLKTSLKTPKIAR